MPTARTKYRPLDFSEISTTTTEQPKAAVQDDTFFKSVGQQEGEQHYVLTFETDEGLHEAVNALRTKYFPPRINKVPAHLTLFHALPESRLESDIVPVIQDLVNRTSSFDIHAGRPFKLSKGIGILVPKHQGGDQAHAVHKALQTPWSKAGFLSPQDDGGIRVHWTIMNKVNDEKHIQKSFEEVDSTWSQPWGVVTGLALWKYEQSGHWTSPHIFHFRGGAEAKKSRS